MQVTIEWSIVWQVLIALVFLVLLVLSWPSRRVREITLDALRVAVFGAGSGGVLMAALFAIAPEWSAEVVRQAWRWVVVGSQRIQSRELLAGGVALGMSMAAASAQCLLAFARRLSKGGSSKSGGDDGSISTSGGE